MELTYREIRPDTTGVFLKNVKLWSICFDPHTKYYYITPGVSGFINLHYYGTGFDVDFLEGRTTYETLDDAKNASVTILEDYIKFLSE